MAYKDQILFYIQWATIVEVCVVILLVVLAYLAKIYYVIKAKYLAKKMIDIRKKLIKISQQAAPPVGKNIVGLSKYLVLLKLIPELDLRNDLPHWQRVRGELIEKILRPTTKKYAKSKSWFKRYVAMIALSYKVEESDSVILKQLIQDKTPLVALNASLAAAKLGNKELVNQIIESGAAGRRLQQSAFADILKKNVGIMAPSIIERLQYEQQPYARVFCYRLLAKTDFDKKVLPFINRDLSGENVDLKVVALSYMAQGKGLEAATIKNCLLDSAWEVRAAAAKTLGKIKDLSSIPLLSVTLKDREWWVRINSAEALIAMGEKGLAVLKAQDSHDDKYAYEAANHVLISYQNKKGENLG